MNESEKKVVTKMILIYCKSQHNTSSGLCSQCLKLRNYAMLRLEKCPFGEQKPTCESCAIHCYGDNMRQEIRNVMRFAGLRMIFIHPIDAIHHIIRKIERDKRYKTNR